MVKNYQRLLLFIIMMMWMSKVPRKQYPYKLCQSLEMQYNKGKIQYYSMCGISQVLNVTQHFHFFIHYLFFPKGSRIY